MQIHSQTAELRALLTITSEKISEEKRTLWLGKLSKELFYSPPCRMAFERIDTLAKKRFKIVSFKSLLEDPRLNEDIRDILAQAREKPCLKKSHRDETLETLEEFRKIRIMHEACMGTIEKLNATQVDTEALLMDLSTAVARANTTRADEDFFLHFGAQSNNDDIIDSICRNETMPRISTGYTDYDTTNGGFPTMGVIILAGTTSGGKSTIAMNICRHMYLVNNLSTFRITLEMQEIQETQRLMSHLTGIPLKRFSQAKLNADDKRKIRAAKASMDAHGKKHGINYTTHSPKGNLSMDDCLRLAKPFGYKVIVIDYVGLLEEDAGSDQWKSLMDAARVAKNFTRETGTLVILLAQLDDEKEKLRYSKGMKEHADVLWQWNYAKPEQRELRIIPMEVSKDRDGELMRFELAERFDIMSAFNMGDAASASGGGNLEFEDDEDNEESGSETRKSKKSSKDKDGKKSKSKSDDGTKKSKSKKSKSDDSGTKKSSKDKGKKKKKSKLLSSDDGPPALA